MKGKETVIRFGGIGGQGVVMSGIIYGEAAMKQGYNVVQSQSYGSTTRGGTTYSDVIISEDEILALHPESLDIFVAMSQDALLSFLPLLKECGILIYNTTMIDFEEKKNYRIYGIPVTKLAVENFSRPIVANIIMLGYVSRIVDIVKPEVLKETILSRVPQHTIEMNKRAFELGYNYKNGG